MRLAKEFNGICILTALLFLFLSWYPGFGQVIFIESFEYTDSVTNHGWLFLPFGDDASTYTSELKTHSGNRSLFMDSIDDDEQRVRYNFSSPLTNVMVEVYMYDDLQQHYGWNHLAVIDNSLGAVMGFSSEFGFGTHYSTEAGYLSSWERTDIPRKEGWHKLAFEVTPDGLKYFIDDILVRNSSHITEIIAVYLLCGNHGYGPATGTVYFDDVKVTGIGQLLVALDIKPGSCPNPVNVKSKGVLPVAILGIQDFSVNDIDVSSLALEGIAPLRSSMEDVSTPVSTNQNDCDCTTEGPDGIPDLTLKFNTQDIVDALGEVDDGDEVVLTLKGNLNDGTEFEGSDCIIIKSKGGKLKKSIANVGGNMPERISLSQNYPNPFNPETKIRYQLPEANHVSLILYNSVGQQIRTLDDKQQPAGFYTVQWNGKDSSGNAVSIFTNCKQGSFMRSGRHC